MAYISGATGGVSYTPMSFTLTCAAFFFALFRQPFFKNNPIAYESVFQKIPDSVIVVDNDNLVTDLNPAAAVAVGRPAQELIGQPARITFAAYPELYARFEHVPEVHEELTLETKTGLRYFDLHIAPLYNPDQAIVGRVLTLRDITERKLRQQEMFDRQLLETQEAFAQQLIQSQERERQRIAAELHDGLGQNLLVIKNRALLGALESGETAAQNQFSTINESIGATLEEVRTIAYNLRPPHLARLGLASTIEEMVERVAAATGLPITARVAPLDGVFTQEAEISLFRIVQEALNNIVKHAAAKSATVQITRDSEQITLLITDDGCGFDYEHTQHSGKRGLGLTSIAERVRMLDGTLQIQTRTGGGTTLTALIPFSTQAKS